MSTTLLAVESIYTVELQDVGTGITEAVLHIQRTLQNVSQGPAEFVPNLAIDDWDQIAPSEIFHYSICRKGESPVVITERVRDKPYRVAVMGAGFVLAPGEVVIAKSASVEYKHANDALVVAMGADSKDPQVEVIAPPSIDWRVSFTSPCKVEDRPPRKVLNGILLGGQIMTVRWYPSLGR